MKFNILILCAFVLTACGSRDGADSIDLSHLDPLLREGDLVFRRGQGLASRAVLVADSRGAYSHTGIVVRDGEGAVEGDGARWKVVHIVPGEREPGGTVDRIKTEPLELFFAPGRASRGAIVRVGEPGISIRAAQRAVGLAATGIAFDHDYDPDDTTRMYCTELIYNVFMREGLDLTDGERSHINLPAFNGDYILPSDIFGSRHVSVIYEF